MIKSFGILRGLSLAFVFFITNAQAQVHFPTCSQVLMSSCDELKISTGGVLSNNQDGSLNFNPLKTLSEYSAAEGSLTKIENVNLKQFENQIIPVFNELRQILLKELETLPKASPYRETYLKRISEMKILIRDRERCQRPSRPPIVGGYDKEKNELILCPIQSHQPASALISTLGHEMGHAIDLCATSGVSLDVLNSWTTCDGRQPDLLDGFFARSIHCCSAKALPVKRFKKSTPSAEIKICNRESEVYADFIGVYLTSRYLRKNQPDNSKSSLLRQLDILGLRFESACSADQLHKNFRYNMIQSNEIQSFLGCRGIEPKSEEPVCSVDDLSFF